jgi:fumarate hydratase class II
MNPEASYRIERDSMGEIRVPQEVLYGAQTQRAVETSASVNSGCQAASSTPGLIKACAAEPMPSWIA